MPTIIYPPSIPWNWMVQRPQQIMRALAARGYTILYEDLGEFAKPNVQRFSPTFILCQGTRALAIPHARPRILWLTVPYHINLIEQYEPDMVVYDAVDEPKEEFAGWAPYYPEILARSDLLFASALSIYQELSKSHANVHLVRNGVDFAHFSSARAPRPADLPNGKPIVGYSGAIASWIDWDLIDSVIKDNPDLEFVFLGTLFELRKFPLKRPNARYLGLKPYSQLPAYLHNFKAALIPFRLTEMTKGCNPIKVYEYYAAGLPVLATPLPELISVPKIYLDSDPDRFSRRLRLLVEKSDFWTNERIAYAQANDWEERGSQISRYLDETINVKRKIGV